MNETTQKQGKSFGWGILGFFFPLVGLILFFVFKNKKQGASKASGLGALIGCILQVLITVISCVVCFGLIGSKKTIKVKTEGIVVTMKEYKKTTEAYKDFDISDIHYQADWSDKIYDLYRLDKKMVTVLDKSGNVAFKVEAKEAPSGTNYDFYIYLNNGKKVELKNDILLIVGLYDFYYTDNLLIFDAGESKDEVYFYEYKQKELVTAFNKNDSNDNGMYVTNIKFNDNKDLIFSTYVNAFDTNNANSGKSGVVIAYDNGLYKNLEELQAALNKYNLGDFILSGEITHKYSKDGYKLKSTQYKTIIEDFKNGGNSTEVKECTGTFEQDTNKNKYVLFSQQRDYPQYDDCTSVTFKLNDDFTVKYLYNDTDTQKKGVYINSKYYDSVDIQGTFYIAGKTLVVSTVHQTTVNGGFSTTLINTNGETYNFAANTQGRDTNKLDTEGKRDDSFVVNENGELVITATRFNNDIDKDYLGDYASKDVTCKLSVDQVASAYNTTADGDYETKYTYKTTSDGLVNFNYSSKKTSKTIREAYKAYCE